VLDKGGDQSFDLNHEEGLRNDLRELEDERSQSVITLMDVAQIELEQAQ